MKILILPTAITDQPGLFSNAGIAASSSQTPIYRKIKSSNSTPIWKTGNKTTRPLEGQKILKPQVCAIRKSLSDTDLIVDALLGIGLKDKPRQPYFDLIELINNSKKTILSLDVPSGLDATTGKAYGTAIKASATITFGLFKKGLFNSQAKAYTGKLFIGDISLPRNLLH